MNMRQVMEILNAIDYLSLLPGSHVTCDLVLRQSTAFALRKFLEECAIRGKVDE